MQQIPLQQVPNQSFTIVLDGNTWGFVFKTTAGITSVSVALNGVDLQDSSPCAAGMFLLPYQYEESGNFIFVTQNFQLPNYSQFGLTQYLLYVSASELATFRAPQPLPLTAADFNPIAPLPLRFQPAGYS